MRRWLLVVVIAAVPAPAGARSIIDIEIARGSHLFQEGKYVEAGDVFYVRGHKVLPYDRDAPVAIYNAAVSYELGHRWQTAIAVYEELLTNSTREFREHPYRLSALRRLAKIHHTMLEHRRARDAYLELYRAAAQAPKLGTQRLPDDPTFAREAADALYNAALEAELANDVSDAIALLSEYEHVETERIKRDRAVWGIALLYGRGGAAPQMAETFARWRATYGRDAGNANNVVESYYRVAQGWQRFPRFDDARAAGDAVIAEWRRLGARPGGSTARMAGEWLLARAETAYDAWESLAPATTDKQIAAFTKRMRELDVAYAEIEALDIPELALAARVRAGDLRYELARKAVDVCTPTPCANVGIDGLVGEARSAWTRARTAALRAGVGGLWLDRAIAGMARTFPDAAEEPLTPIVVSTERL